MLLKTSLALAAALLLSATPPAMAAPEACPAPAAAAAIPATPAQRGVWVATPEHTRFFDSRAEMGRQLDLFKQAGIDTVYAAMWNQGRTLFPSQVVKRLTGVLINERAAGRDPLQELVEEAHARGLKVYAWFEFGFASDYQGGPGRELVLKHPEWAALDAAGKPVVKNGFSWMNALDPSLQRFLLDLILEAVRGYDIDGIQGDDRLPAMASEGGYNPVNIARYQAEHGGKSPPADFRDPAWVRWRAGKLNDFMRQLHGEVKAAKPAIQISMSPSPYPWGVDEYLQDWPTWLREGWVDSLAPQIYRYNIEGYRKELRKLAREQLCPAQRARVFPGVLLALGKSYVISAELLRQMIEENRREGFPGEVHFHSEGVAPRLEVLKSLYR